jgi:hypothetical protein
LSTLLPPVKKRRAYADIRATDLAMALFYDRVLGLEAMKEAKEVRADVPPADEEQPSEGEVRP